MQESSRNAQIASAFRPRWFIFPKEHGAWAMWIVPGVIGAGLAGANYGLSALFLTSVLLWYWARYPVWQWARSRGRRFPSEAVPSVVVTAFAGTVMASALAVAYGRWGVFAFGAALAVLGAVHLLLLMKSNERAIAAEFAGIASLGLTGPATYYFATGTLNSQVFLSWLLPFLFFGTSVFAVKLRVEGHVHRKAGRSYRPLVVSLVAYQVLVPVVMCAVAALGYASFWTLIAFVPVTLQAIWTPWTLQSPPRFKQLGILWTIHSAIFTALLLALVQD